MVTVEKTAFLYGDWRRSFYIELQDPLSVRSWPGLVFWCFGNFGLLFLLDSWVLPVFTKTPKP